MCEPLTVAAVGAAAVSAAGGVVKGNAAAAAGRLNAQIDESNARLADVAAGDSNARGSTAASMSLLREGATVAQKTADVGGAGVDVGRGSPLAALADASATSRLDAAVIQNNAARDAWGYEKQATNFREKASLDEQTGDNAQIEAYIGGASSALQLGMKAIPVAG